MHNEGMPTIQIRNVPEDLHRELVERAKREGRSLTQETLVVLRAGLAARDSSRLERRRKLFEQMLKNAREMRGKQFTPAEDLIREDRDNR